MLTTFQALKSIDAFHDTSSAFFNYWRDRDGVDVKLKLRSAHKIIPHVRNVDASNVLVLP